MRFLPILFFIFTSLALAGQNFRVQAAAFADSVNRSYFTDRGIQGVTVVHSGSGIWQYLVGSYPTREAAEEIQAQLVAKGFPNPVVIDLEAERVLANSKCAYTNGKTAPDQEDEGDNPVRIIFFGSGKYTLDTKARAELDRYIDKMNADKTLELRMMGFTDSKGEAADNYDLAGARAKAARNYLINKGIRATRLYVEVYGEADPLYENKDFDGNEIPENMRYNNRVMLKFKEAGDEK